MGIKQKEENTNGGLHNTLAAGTTVKGDIVTETDFRLDGKIEGDVSCRQDRDRPERERHGKHRFHKCRNIRGSGRFHTRQCQTCPESDRRHQRRYIRPNARDRTERPLQRGLQDVRGKITTKSFFIIKSQNRRSVFSFNSVTSCFISDSRPYRNKTFTHVPSSKTTI